MEIPVAVEGVITNSEHPDHRVRVEDDSENAGGFLIFEWWDGSDGPNENGGFDSWVQSHEALEAWFEETGWKIKWSSAV